MGGIMGNAACNDCCRDSAGVDLEGPDRPQPARQFPGGLLVCGAGGSASRSGCRPAMAGCWCPSAGTDAATAATARKTRAITVPRGTPGKASAEAGAARFLGGEDFDILRPAPGSAPPRRAHRSGSVYRLAVVQWIEHAPPKREMQVRFLPAGPPHGSQRSIKAPPVETQRLAVARRTRLNASPSSKTAESPPPPR